MQPSSVRSSFPPLIAPVMHFLKHMSVREWTAIKVKGKWNVSIENRERERELSNTQRFLRAPGCVVGKRVLEGKGEVPRRCVGT